MVSALLKLKHALKSELTQVCSAQLQHLK